MQVVAVLLTEIVHQVIITHAGMGSIHIQNQSHIIIFSIFLFYNVLGERECAPKHCLVGFLQSRHVRNDLIQFQL
jgi:hypothetical protein